MPKHPQPKTIADRLADLEQKVRNLKLRRGVAAAALPISPSGFVADETAFDLAPTIGTLLSQFAMGDHSHGSPPIIHHQVLDEGVDQGDAGSFNYTGAGVSVSVAGGVATITIAGATTRFELDAVVDMTLAVSDPANRYFKGIGEALTYIRTTLGQTERAVVLVRSHPTQTNPGLGNRYQETGNVTAPNEVYLISSTPTTNGTSSPEWDHNGFTMNGSRWFINGLVINGKATGAPTAAKTSLLVGEASLFDCDLKGDLMTNFPNKVSTGLARLYRCSMKAGWFRFDEAYNGDFRIYTAGTYSPCNNAAFPTYFVMLDCAVNQDTLFGAGIQWNLDSTYTQIRFSPNFNGGQSTVPILNLNAASGRYYIDNLAGGELNEFLTIASVAGISYAVLRGYFNDVTLVAPNTVGYKHLVEAHCSSLDITGPATIDARANLTKVRGRAVLGELVTRRSGASGGTAVDLIAATDCQLQIANGLAPAAGTTKSYNFDAASTGNLLVWQNHQAYPVAGTNAGTNNRVLPEGTTPWSGINSKGLPYSWQSAPTLAVGVGKRFAADQDGTISFCRAERSAADGSGTATLDVLLNGVSIFPAAAKPTVAAATFLGPERIPDIVTFVKGDYFQIEIEATGGGTGPLRLTIHFS